MDRKPDVEEYCRIEGPTLQRMLEFKTFEFPLAGTAIVELPASPGAVQRDAGGRATLLHFAAGRFLVPAPLPDMARHLGALQTAGVGAVFDVDGKWRTFALAGRGAERVLASTIDLGQVLQHRDCAALHLFDCPAVLARRAEAFDVWVEASYASAFRECVNRAATTCWEAMRDMRARRTDGMQPQLPRPPIHAGRTRR
jgi:sarcosine oxidase gamma subunit